MAEPCLIFDLDGTLIHSAPQIHAISCDLLAEEGLPPLSAQTIQGFVGNGLPTLIARILNHLSLSHDLARQDRMVARAMSIYQQRFERTMLYPGVVAALDTLGQGFRLGLCTNKPEGPTRAVLAHFGMQERFAALVCGDTLPQHKPHPAPLLHTISLLGGGPAIFVGDSEVDAQTAQAAGVPFALYTEGYRKTAPQDLGAKWIFSDYAELPGLLQP